MRQIRAETIDQALRLDERTVVAIVRGMNDVDLHLATKSTKLILMLSRFFDHVCQVLQRGATLKRARELLARLFATALPPHDVHGRATIVQLPREELERRFGRR